MRVVRADTYAETRDCLAHDWAVFLAAVLPDVAWLPVPNLGSRVGEFARNWALDGFILTGGNDLGDEPGRDATEASLLALALDEGLPLLGVCRGLQMIQRHFGGVLQPADRERHVGTRHSVQTCAGEWGTIPPQDAVNSFHGWGVTASRLATPLRGFAVSDDGLAEGIWLPGSHLAAVQWHPERLSPPHAADRALVRWLFGQEA
jgi:putative glutamine amidotransferase